MAPFSIVFKEGQLNSKQTLAIANEEVRSHIESLVSAPSVFLDKCFIYYLLGATGICVVPLSSFATDLQGSLVTLLEKNEAEFRRIFATMAAAIRSYLDS